ncbi:MAG: PAS domain-containing protein [Desulfobacteraceae bacterium]|nr:PAS domain-containing protein [Desulfobacteraceae bacterium]
MLSYSIPDPETMVKEIEMSHERCKQYDIDPNEYRSVHHECLSKEDLKVRLEQNRPFLDIVVSHLESLYQFVAGAGFAVNIADKDGYILHALGDRPIMEFLENANCSPGYRWNEKNVGTGAISLTLKRKMPVQINDDEHFCQRGYGFTCSASPLFGPANALIGAIAMTGMANLVHPHTLGMVITTAMAIENELRIQKTSKKLKLHNNYMNSIIESIDSGVMTIDKDGIIKQVNNQGQKILQWTEPLEGRPLRAFLKTQITLNQIMSSDFEFVDREIFVPSPRGTIHLMCTIRPIFDSSEKMDGVIIVFNEINRIRRLVNEMAGSQARFTFEDIIGISSGIQEAKKMAIMAASGGASVLLLGETGTGKELFAQSIHNESERSAMPFLAINCGAMPRDLLESELFGYSEGSFTGAKKGGRPGKFELANGGTFFLDEVGDMPSYMQVKLLRVLQTGEVYRIGEHKPIAVDVRIIAATNVKIKERVEQGGFREDLFYRLNVFPIYIPPIRERTEDIMPMATHKLNKFSRNLNKPKLMFSNEAAKALLKYPWPGNVRELENVIERAVNLAQDNTIGAELLDISSEKTEMSFIKKMSASSLDTVVRYYIHKTVKEKAYNLSDASKALGISRATLYNKIKKYQIPIKR